MIPGNKGRKQNCWNHILIKSIYLEQTMLILVLAYSFPTLFYIMLHLSPMRSTVIFFLIYHALTFLFLRNRFDPHTKLYGHSSTIIDQIQRQCQFCLLMNIQNILSEIFSPWKCLLCEEWLKGSNISINHPTLTHFRFLHYLLTQFCILYYF